MSARDRIALWLANRILASAEQTLGSSGSQRIAAERLRQVIDEGWTPEHDDEHNGGMLALAGCAYAFAGAYTDCERWKIHPPAMWPWPHIWWKPGKTIDAMVSIDGRIRNLTKAGALIAAEIDRLQRKKDRGEA